MHLSHVGVAVIFLRFEESCFYQAISASKHLCIHYTDSISKRRKCRTWLLLRMPFWIIVVHSSDALDNCPLTIKNYLTIFTQSVASSLGWWFSRWVSVFLLNGCLDQMIVLFFPYNYFFSCLNVSCFSYLVSRTVEGHPLSLDATVSFHLSRVLCILVSLPAFFVFCGRIIENFFFFLCHPRRVSTFRI